MQGAFVNNGSDLAAGVAGSWNYNDGSYYSVSGVFMGEGYTPSISASLSANGSPASSIVLALLVQSYKY